MSRNLSQDAELFESFDTIFLLDGAGPHAFGGYRPSFFVAVASFGELSSTWVVPPFTVAPVFRRECLG
jgi:hypothetical protein